MTLLRGRDCEPRNVEAGAKIGAINQTMADAYFRGRGPIGRTVTLDDETFTIVAVVRDMQEHRVRDKPDRHLYMAENDPTPRTMSFERQMHVGGDASRVIASLRDALRAADRTIPLAIQVLDERVRATVESAAARARLA